MNDVDRGYLAGMIDGEGSITYNVRPNIRIHVTNTHRECLEHIRDVVGKGYVYKQRQNGKTIYRYCLNRQQDVLTLLSFVVPALIIKKKKAREVIKSLTRSRSADTSFS